MLKKILITVGVVVLLLGVFIFDTVKDAGYFREIEPHFAGTCSMVEGPVGAEDITIDSVTGTAYISAHNRRAKGDNREDGFIYTYALEGAEEGQGALTVMTHNFDGAFYPHGISLWKNPAGPDRLFVVNHPVIKIEDRDEILSEVVVFDVAGSTLRHVRTVKTDGLYSLNDVAAIDGDHFYASIDRGSVTPLGRMLESYGRLKRGGVAYGNTDIITKAAGNLIFPNGIQLSGDGKTLYVAETTGERLLAYERNAETNALSLIAETEIDSGLDNLEWDAEGNLWIGSHPRAIDFLPHGADAANRSPSQVLKVSWQRGELKVEEVYLNDGNPLSGSSVGAPYRNRLLIGAVFEPFFLDCKMAGPEVVSNP